MYISILFAAVHSFPRHTPWALFRAASRALLLFRHLDACAGSVSEEKNDPEVEILSVSIPAAPCKNR